MHAAALRRRNHFIRRARDQQHRGIVTRDVSDRTGSCGQLGIGAWWAVEQRLRYEVDAPMVVLLLFQMDEVCS